MKTTKDKDSIDIEVVNRLLTTKEKQAFSEFLKKRKKKKKDSTLKNKSTTTEYAGEVFLKSLK